MSESIEVEVADQTAGDTVVGQSVLITDRKGGRAWSGEGQTASEAATRAVRKLLGDRRVREYVG